MNCLIIVLSILIVCIQVKLQLLIRHLIVRLFNYGFALVQTNILLISDSFKHLLIFLLIF
jgi:hypothetical protein